MEIQKKNNATKGLLVAHGTLWNHALNEGVSRWYVEQLSYKVSFFNLFF